MAIKKNAFWQAALFSIIIFGMGLILGYFLEQKISKKFTIETINSEIKLLDQQIRDKNLQNFNISCELKIKNTINFANEIYEEASYLEKYESQQKFTNTLKTIHKKYDLLRVMLWSQSIDIKEKCGDVFHTVVYIYEYGPEDIEIKAKQTAISRMLIDIKKEHGDKIILIPFAGNMNLSSIEIVKSNYKVTKLPIIIIDEKIVVQERITVEELEKLIFAKK